MLLCEVEFIVNGRLVIKVLDDLRDMEVFILNYLLLFCLGFLVLFGFFFKDEIYFCRCW